MAKDTLLGAPSTALRRKQKVDLIVGLDFGTSSTKVAYRELGSASRKVVPIAFDHKLKTYPTYCLPSVGFISPDRRLVWGPEAVRKLERESWSSGIRRLKVLVAGEQDLSFRDIRAVEAYNSYLASVGLNAGAYRPEYVAAFALARQMHVVREILTNRYRNAELDIRFNMCVPIYHMEHSRMLGVHNKINHVAEDLYRTWVADGWEDNELIDLAASKFDDAKPEIDI